MRKIKATVSELTHRQGELMDEKTIGTFIFHMSDRQMRNFISKVNNKSVRVEVEEVA